MSALNQQIHRRKLLRIAMVAALIAAGGCAKEEKGKRSAKRELRDQRLQTEARRKMLVRIRKGYSGMPSEKPFYKGKE
jgi:hypothetical protein